MTNTQTIDQKEVKQYFLTNYRQEKLPVSFLLGYIQVLYSCGGPAENEYTLLNDALSYYRTEVPLDEWKALSKEVAKFFGEDFIDSISGHAYIKPFGYAGDFSIIDKMYLKTTSNNPMLAKWDLYFHQEAAATAVRNRKTFFKNLLANRMSKADSSFEVLDVASGPCRDLLEFMEEHPEQKVHFDCVEVDINAILFATELNAKHLPKITFYNQNIFRFKADKKYDIVWSAGLFDYFDDKTFTKLVRQLITCVKPGGELIIGNFAQGNPSEGYMELLLDWYLYHRSPAQLISLAQAAGIADASRITIDKEEAGVNLFMRIQF